MDTGYSNFKFQASCFDTSVVTHNRLTINLNGLRNRNHPLFSVFIDN